MSRILLADDSPHAQRMGERILREEGFEVVSVTDGRTALVRLADVDPDVVFADVSLPGHSGYDICEQIKNDPRRRHVRVILTAGLLEDFDDARAVAVRSDGVLKKPFEASLVLSMVKPMAEAAVDERDDPEAGVPEFAAEAAEAISAPGEVTGSEPQPPERPPDPPSVHSVAEAVRARFALERMNRPAAASVPHVIHQQPVQQHTIIPQPAQTQPARGSSAVPVRVVTPPRDLRDANGRVDPERVQAAVTIALDAAMPEMIDKITEQILIALGD